MRDAVLYISMVPTQLKTLVKDRLRIFIKLFLTNFFSVARRECTLGSDYVTVQNGELTTSPILKTLCGSSVPVYVYSTGNLMKITLKSANNIRQAGFSATWMALTIPTTPPTVKIGMMLTVFIQNMKVLQSQ